MLYRTLKRLVERGQIAGLVEKLDIFFAAGKLTEAEYMGLTQEINKMEKSGGGANYRLTLTLPTGIEVTIHGR